MIARRISECTAQCGPVDLAVEPLGVEDPTAGPGEVCKEHTECDRKQEQRLELFSDGKIEKNERIMQLPVEGEKLVKEMKSAKGKAIFFILIKNFWRVRFFLLNQGFVEGTDFVDGFMFLSERHGLNLGFDSRPILQEM